MTEEKKRWSKVVLPEDVADPIEVYVNSITQRPGVDYEREGNTLYFFRPIRNEEKLGFFRWLILFIAKQNACFIKVFVLNIVALAYVITLFLHLG